MYGLIIFLTTKSCNNFLIIDYKIPNSNDHTMAFSSDECINTLGLSNFWIMDGTFSTSPSLFKKVYLIHRQVETYNSCILSLVYILLTSINEQIYKELFFQLKDYT